MSLWPFSKPNDLFVAAKRGDVRSIEELAANGHDVNSRKSGFVREGYAPLHIAVLHNREEAIKSLVKLGADINGKNNDKETPLWTAVTESRNPRIIELLLELGAKIHARTDLGTVLDWAAFEGDLEMVRLLLSKGANPIVGRGSTRSAPIQRCANNGNVEILELLLNSGADVNAANAGSHALTTAAVFGHDKFVKVLLQAGADANLPDESGTTPLMSGVAGRKIEIVRMLVEAGANLNAVRFRGNAETALDFAEDNPKTKPIADYLRSVGAKRASELPASETKPPPEDQDGTSWQLRDDSMLEVTIKPWPPKTGLAKLKVEIGPNGHDPDIPFSGTLEYRLAPSMEDSGPWKVMKSGRTDEENNVRFSDGVTLTQGTLYVQFRVHPKWHNEATVVESWKIEVT